MAELETTAASSGLVAKFAALYGVPALWLASGPGDAPPLLPPNAPPRDFADPRHATDEEFEIVRDFRDLADGDRERFVASLRQMAEAYRGYRAGVIADLRARGKLKEET